MYEDLITRLAGKDSMCGSSICKQSILIGDVLQQIKKKFDKEGIPENITDSASTATIFAVMNRWCKLDYSKSLQQILIDEVEEVKAKYQHGAFGMKPYTIKQLSPRATELIEFLNKIL